MSSTNQTSNYQLPLFIGTDKPTWLGDFNGAMNKIDTAIKGVSDVASGNTSSIGSVESDVESLKTQVGTLENTVASHTSTLASQGQNITALTTKTNQHDTQISAINNNISDINDDISGIRSDLTWELIGTVNSTTITNLIKPVTNFNEILIIDDLSGSIRGSINVPSNVITVGKGFEITYNFGSSLKYDGLFFDTLSSAHKDETSYDGTFYIYGRNVVS